MEDISVHTGGGGKSFHDEIDEVRRLAEENLRYTKIVHEFTPKDAIEREQAMVKLLQDNLEYTKACYALLEKIRRWILWQHVFTVLKLIIIIVPIVIAILYLPPLLKSSLAPYMELLNEAKKLP